MAKSFQLAVDVNDYDLFMDLYHSAKRLGYQDLADASLVKARSIFFDNSARGTPNPESYPRESTFTNPSSVKRLSIAGEIPHNYAGQHGRGREMGSHSQERLGSILNSNSNMAAEFNSSLINPQKGKRPN